MRTAETAARRRRLILRVLGFGLFAVTAWLVAEIVRETDWPAVLAALRRREAADLVLIAALALASHALYGCIDVIGARALRLRLPRRRVWLTATGSYACNLNLGSLVGAAALRFKLYGRQGVAAADISRMIAISVAANWMGHLALFATLPLWGGLAVLARWTGRAGALGLCLVAAAAVALYLLACWRAREWNVRGYRFRFPRWRLGLSQIAVAAANWALIGAVLQRCLGDGADYAATLAALLIAAVAGAAVHVPGGWGVLDYVILKSLAGSLDAHRIVAGVLVYRAAYYLLPLALAALSIAWLLRRAPPSAAAADEPA
ncbi:lysylphosphatidylglycerol synthase transmembrane domain-containing protein [Tahibacter caeni]|uniref:lysylphosphatidylglycerol synthase transmembrane domain-containing protein n=1 Tax=Tahibacter caeni TaxID=1453545 RepID=UPI00214885E3|nr:YbhN family protein [Tahibacter caeni]